MRKSMKKKLVLFACTSLMIGGLTAQEARPVRFAFAIQPSSSWLKPDGQILEKEKSRLGFAYGVIVDITLAGNENYVFSTGIMVNSQGGTILNKKFHDQTTTIPIGEGPETMLDPRFAEHATENYKLQYIDIPLTLKLRTNEIGYMTYYGQFGLDLGINIKANKITEYNFKDGNTLEIMDEDVLDEIRLFRGALQVGAGAEYNISGNTTLLVGLVWNNGLTNTFNRNYFAEDSSGNPALTDDRQRIREGGRMKVISNFLGLTVGVFF